MRNKLYVRNVRIALAQINATVGDFKGNYEKIVDFIEKSKHKRADIVLFPELGICGYPPEDLLLNIDFINTAFRYLKKVTAFTNDIVVLLGAPFFDKGKLYNACFVMQNRKIKHIYKKIFLPYCSVFDEKRYFHPGEEVPIFVNDRIFFGVTICEDIWVESSPVFEESFCGKTDIIFNLSASPFFAGKINIRKNLLKKLALKTKNYVAYCNLVGGQDELVFDGRSLVFSPEGEELVEAKAFGEDLVCVDLETKNNSAFEKTYEGKFNIVNIKLESFPAHKRKKISLKKKEKRESSLESDVYNALVLGTKDYVFKNGFKKAIVGLSGGIDSSLTATIACDALGNDNVIGVSMPSEFTSSESIEDARILAANLGIKFYIVPIKEIFEVYKKIFIVSFGKPKDITLQNIQARIRGNILMAFSNNFGWIVLTTGNKSETSVGYCTLYGDTVGGFAVLKDVPKTFVYRLARYRNKLAGFDLIPKRVLIKPPSAELKTNQKDEDELGSYRVLDAIINLYVEKNLDLDRIVKKGFDSDTVKRIISKIDRNEYKRRQFPPGIKITPRSFGKDRRMPITNRFIFS